MRRWWVASLSLTFVAACSPGDGGGSDPATARRCAPGATLKLAYNDNTVIEDQGKIMGSRIDGERRRVVESGKRLGSPLDERLAQTRCPAERVSWTEAVLGVQSFWVQQR